MTVEFWEEGKADAALWEVWTGLVAPRAGDVVWIPVEGPPNRRVLQVQWDYRNRVIKVIVSRD